MEGEDFSRQLSVSPYSAPNSQLLQAASSSSKGEEVAAAAERGKRVSIESTTSPTTATSVSLPMNANNKSGGARRVSVINASAANQKWKVFLERGEELVTTGLTGKPNPVGIQLIREIILVRSPARDLAVEEQQQLPVSKRLIYIDANSFEMKGEIIWVANTKLPIVKKVLGMRHDMMIFSDLPLRLLSDR